VRAKSPDLASDILLAPHHGSNTSSSYAFIKQVMPQFVVYSSGYRNSFGHPTQRTRKRYQELGSRAYISYETGMLSFTVRPNGVVNMPQQYRQQRRRYWY